MSNFFNDYLIDPNQIKVINNIYEGVFKLLENNLKDVDNVLNLSKVPTYKKIDFQMIATNEAHYTLHELLNKDIVSSMLNFSLEESFQSKKIKWKLLSSKQKAAIVDAAGYSIALTAIALIRRSEYLNNIKFNVISFELYDKSDQLLTRNVDYVFVDNKIIIIKEREDESQIRDSNLILKNIVIDCNASEDLIGTKMKINYSNDITKNYYNSSMKAFVKASAGGPTLNNLSESLQSHNITRGIRIYDKFNAPKIKKGFWNTYSENGLTEFDFMVSLPLSFMYNQQKLNIISQFFNNIRPAYSNFVFSPALDVEDDIKKFIDIKAVKPNSKIITSVFEKMNVTNDPSGDLPADENAFFDNVVVACDEQRLKGLEDVSDSIGISSESINTAHIHNTKDIIKASEIELKKISFLTNEIVEIFSNRLQDELFDGTYDPIDKILMRDFDKIISKLNITEVIEAILTINYRGSFSIKDMGSFEDNMLLLQKIKIIESTPIVKGTLEEEILICDENDTFDYRLISDGFVTNYEIQEQNNKLNVNNHYDKINLLVSNCQIIKLLVTDTAQIKDYIIEDMR